MATTHFGFSRRSILLLILTLTPLLAGCGRKDDPRLSTPKLAARTLFQAMYDNDLATAKSCVVEGPGQQEMVAGMTGMMSSMRRATDAIYKRFGQEMQKMAGGALDVSHIDGKQIDAAVETIDGDTATLQLPNQQSPLKLARTNKAWKVDLMALVPSSVNVNDPMMLRAVTGMYAAMNRGADRVTAEVQAGKYTDARTATLALTEGMKQAIADEQQRMIKEMSPQ